MEFWRDTARYELTTPDRRSPRLCCVDAALLLEGPGLSRLGDDVCHPQVPALFRRILDAPQGRASAITPVRRAGLSGTTHLPGFLKPAARHAEQPYPNRTVMIARELWVYAAYRKSQIAEGSALWSSGPCPRTAHYYGAS